jgi:hypothetical protein
MRVQGSTDPLGARLLLTIVVPESPLCAQTIKLRHVYMRARTFRAIAKWHAVRLLVCGVDGMNVHLV